MNDDGAHSSETLNTNVCIYMNIALNIFPVNHIVPILLYVQECAQHDRLHRTGVAVRDMPFRVND